MFFLGLPCAAGAGGSTKRLLLAHGALAHLNTPNAQQETPLRLASVRQHAGVVAVLESHQAVKNAVVCGIDDTNAGDCRFLQTFTDFYRALQIFFGVVSRLFRTVELMPKWLWRFWISAIYFELRNGQLTTYFLSSR